MRDADARWLASITVILGLTLLPGASYVASMRLVQGEWGLSNAQAGLVFSAYQFGYMLAVVVLLPLTDRRDPAMVVRAAALCSVAGHALFALTARGLPSGMAALALAGVGLGGVYMPGLRLVAERFAAAGRGRAVGLYVTAFYLGTSLSLAVTGAFLPLLGWRKAYLVMAGCSLIGVTLSRWISGGTRTARPDGGAGRGNHAARVDGEPDSPNPSARAAPAPRATAAVLRNRPALLMIGGYVAHAWELYAVRGWFAPYLAALLAAGGTSEVSATATGARLAAAVFGIGALGVPFGGALSDRFGRTGVAAVCLATSGACSLIIGWIGGVSWILVAGVGVIYALAISADSPVYSTAVTELADPRHLGATMALQATLGFGAGFAAPVAVGLVLDRAPSAARWGLGFGLAGAGAILGLMSVLLARRTGGPARGAS
ncbi:MAG: MFS transporter [Armatimonadetes bacterium]|nr:MFS transporter [Armatimonadota bacterium]